MGQDFMIVIMMTMITHGLASSLMSDTDKPYDSNSDSNNYDSNSNTYDSNTDTDTMELMAFSSSILVHLHARLHRTTGPASTRKQVCASVVLPTCKASRKAVS